MSMGLESLAHSMRREHEASPILAGMGHLLLGAIAGGVSLFVLPARLVPRGPLPGLSLVLSPLATGIIMHALGEWWRDRNKPRPILFSFQGGAVFAFGMALVRFLYFR